jgi:hypothetical protein
VGLGGDFTEDHDHTGLGCGLASDLGEGVLLEAGIEDGVRDLIAGLQSAVSVFGGSRGFRKWGGGAVYHAERYTCLIAHQKATLKAIGETEVNIHTRSCRGDPHLQTLR